MFLFRSARFLFALACICGLLLALPAHSETPENAGRVTDLAAVLSRDETLLMTQALAQYERETTHQIAVLTLPSLAGETIEVFSLRVANAWKLGRKGINNGILVVLAPTERKIRIELGLGFERYISNSQASAIIQTHMLSDFREQAYARGLARGIHTLMEQGRAFVAPK